MARILIEAVACAFEFYRGRLIELELMQLKFDWTEIKTEKVDWSDINSGKKDGDRLNVRNRTY